MAAVTLLISSDQTWLIAQTEAILQQLDPAKDWQAHNLEPDFHWFGQDQPITIEEGRAIIRLFTHKPYQSRATIVCITQFDQTTVTTQNALLKLFEEPPEYAIIVLWANRWTTILPTILSRCLVVEQPLTSVMPQQSDIKETIENLQKASIGQRLKSLQKVMADKQTAVTYLDQLIQYYRLVAVETPTNRKHNITLLRLFLHYQTLLDQQIQPKMIATMIAFQLAS